jgi:hypothetical protein
VSWCSALIFSQRTFSNVMTRTSLNVPDRRASSVRNFGTQRFGESSWTRRDKPASRLDGPTVSFRTVRALPLTIPRSTGFPPRLDKARRHAKIFQHEGIIML